MPTNHHAVLRNAPVRAAICPLLDPSPARRAASAPWQRPRGAGLPRRDRLLRGLHRPAQPRHAPARARADAGSWASRRCAWSSTGHDVAPAANSATRPSFEATNPAQLQLGRVRRAARRSRAAALAGAADGHLAGAALGDLQPEGAVRHQPRRPGLRTVHDGRGAPLRLEVSLYAIWNEPNHPAFLRRSSTRNGTPASPRIYRGLYQAGYAGLQAGGLAASAGADGRNRADRLRHGQ